MLSTAKPILQLDIQNALNSSSTQKVFENALLSIFPDIDDDNEGKKMAEMFGKLCAKGLASALSQPLTDAIDKYVKEIGIMIAPKTLMSPMGPVTGAIAPTDVNIF
jgi:hypothetical protein